MNMTKTYISASAGSGKTYTVTTKVANLIRNNQLKPEKVIITTFTKAAAQELRERTKTELVNLKLYDQAQQMEHALIGTVHSVANSFLTKYWYLLGIMPDAAAMEEEELKVFRDHSLRGLLEPHQRQFLYDFVEKYEISHKWYEHKNGLNYEFWKEDLCKVLDYMQWYSMTDEQLSIDTTESFIKCLGPKNDYKEKLIKDVINECLGVIKASNRPSKKMNEQRDLLTIYQDRKLNFDEIEILATIAKERVKETDNGKAYIKWATEKLVFSQENCDHLKKYAEIIFDLAKEWRKMYRKYKDEHHLIDFNDMEEMFLTLLDKEEVKKDIKSNYTHLFVDEFQDSNPMQVQIFQKLSSLLTACYVGDKKQAIYGFRGSDTELTSAVSDSMQHEPPLSYSYRSVEPLVKLSNSLFTQIFSDYDSKEVELQMPEDKNKGNRDIVERPLRIWPWNNDEDLAKQILGLILTEGYDPSDIAVLGRTNRELDNLSKKLRDLNIPVCREMNDIKESRTGRLLKALLTLIVTPSNLLARAEVAYLTEPGYNITRIIENRLEHIQQKDSNTTYLAEVPILKRLDALRHFKSDEDLDFSRNLLGYQSISAMIESLIIELDLYALVQSWENATAEQTNLQVFIDLAHKYEDSATKIACPATVTGFIDFFTNQVQKSAANDKGVRLFTYHKSKGLEWKVVILHSLQYNPSDDTNIAMQNMMGCHNHRKEKPTAKEPNKPMTISLVYDIFNDTDEIRSEITARFQKHDLWKSVRQAVIEEAARLLYVGVTRARNILILSPIEGEGGSINLNWFRSVGINNINQVINPDDTSLDVFNNEMPFYIERASSDTLSWNEERELRTHDFGDTYSSLHNKRNLSPSKAGNTPHNFEKISKDEHRIIIKNKKEEEALMGDFIHQVFCCCDDDISTNQIKELRDSYGFTDDNLKEPKDLLDAWNYLKATLEKKYGPSIKCHHEKPFRHMDENGHIVTGYIDLIWETDDAYVIVDYKTCPGNYKMVFEPENKHFVGRHGDQLDCYQRALEAEGKKKVKARVIYYPVTQFVVEVK